MQKIKMILFLVITIIIILLLLMFGYTLSKYISNISSLSSSSILKPILVLEGDTNINLTEVNTEKEYTFSIKNYDTNNVLGVNMNYQIEIVSNLDNLEYKLFSNNQEIQLTNGKSDKISIFANDKIVHNYVLKFKVNPDLKNEDIVGNMKIFVNAYQTK